MAAATAAVAAAGAGAESSIVVAVGGVAVCSEDKRCEDAEHEACNETHVARRTRRHRRRRASSSSVATTVDRNKVPSFMEFK